MRRLAEPRASDLMPGDARERRTRRVVISSFAAFVVAVLGANGTMIMLAVRTTPGLAVPNAYERGLAYNDVLRAARDQARLGWQADLAFRQGSPLAGRLELQLRDREQQPISRAEIEVLLVRPAEAGLDFRAQLVARGAGLFASELIFPKPGVWDALVAIRGESGTLSRRERLMVR